MSRDNRRNRPSYYAPPSRGNSSHSALGYWVPLVVTGTLAIGGLAAWIWSERSADDEDDYAGPKPQRPPPGQGKPYPTQGSQPYPGPPQQQAPSGTGSAPPVYPGGPTQGPPGGEAASYYQQDSQSRDVHASGQQQYEQSGWYGRVQGVVRRTPSPQQFFDNASKQVTAGIAAAGAALGSIVEEGRDDDFDDSRRTARSQERRAERRTGKDEREKEGFSDHERWSEEADEKQRVSTVDAGSSRRVDAAKDLDKGKGRAKRSVAVVVSADTGDAAADDHSGYRTEHASILSHLPTTHTSTTDSTDLFVLIQDPTLKSLPPLNYQPQGNGIPSTVGSTYSAISTPAVTPGSELQSMSPRIDAQDSGSPSKTFDLLYQQALTLVSSPTHILPFTTSAGFVPILRHLAPNLVYVSDTLAGDEGANLAQLKGWVGNTVLVAGDQGTGGLADTETETEDERRDDGRGIERRSERKWYERSELVGLGKGVEVVDAARVGDDWAKRVGGRE